MQAWSLLIFATLCRRARLPTVLGACCAPCGTTAKGDWSRAHEIVQDEEGRDAAWVHAYLHRKEGDLANAGYWYRRAGKPACKTSLEDEWEAIAAALGDDSGALVPEPSPLAPGDSTSQRSSRSSGNTTSR